MKVFVNHTNKQIWNGVRRYVGYAGTCHVNTDGSRPLGTSTIRSRDCFDNIYLIRRMYTNKLHVKHKKTPEVLIRKIMQIDLRMSNIRIRNVLGILVLNLIHIHESSNQVNFIKFYHTY